MRLAEVQIQTLLIRRFSPPLTLLIVDFFKLCMHDGHSAYREHGFFSFTSLVTFFFSDVYYYSPFDPLLLLLAIYHSHVQRSITFLILPASPLGLMFISDTHFILMSTHKYYYYFI